MISVDIPRVWNNQEWVQAFEKFLDVIDVHHVRLSDSIFDVIVIYLSNESFFNRHLYGTSLGGFLALLFAQHRPRRVKSLVLSNAFLDTKYFLAAIP